MQNSMPQNNDNLNKINLIQKIIFQLNIYVGAFNSFTHYAELYSVTII